MTGFLSECAGVRKLVAGLVLVLVWLGVTPGLEAQTQAASALLEGTVTDQSGAVVAGASVEVRRPTTGWVRTVTTDENGRYVLPNLPVGTYDVTVSMTGFQPIKYEGIVLTVGGRLTRDVTLNVSGVAEAVTVTGETPLIETSRPTFQQTLNTKSILNLPLIARGFEAFVKLTPGVVESARNTQSFGGQKGINSNYTIDGADRNNPFFGGQSGGDRPPFSVSIESIREFVVLNNGYNAEFGRSGAGLVNVVTTSGSNDWHGKGWYYLLHSDFITDTAATPSGVAPIAAAGRRQQFGGDFGGRIVRDRAFFYVNTDNQKRTVPLALRLIADPADCATVVLAPGITPADCDAARQALLDVEKDISGTDDLWSFLGKVDFRLTPGNNLSGRYNYHRSLQANGTHGFDAFGVTQYAGSETFFGSERDRNHNVVIALTSVITPQHVNEARFNYNWEDRPRIQNPIPGANTANGVSDGTAVIVTGITSSRPALGAVDFLPIPETDTRTQLTDSFTYVFGKHDLKLGVDYNHSTVEQVFRGNSRGVFTFDNFANFVNRAVNRYRQFFGSGELSTSVDEFAFFAQDTWKVRSDLTLSYGLRWEGQFNPSNETPNTTFPEGTEEIPDDTRMWAPRVGIAYNPTSKAVIRLWGGFFYSRTPMLLMQPPLNNNGDATGGFTIDVSTGNALLTGLFTSPYAGPYDIPFDTSPLPVPASGHVTGSDIRRMALEFKNSRTFRTGPLFEYQVTKDTTVSASYTYSFTTHLQRLRNINLAPACSGVPLNANYDALCGMGVPVYSTSLRARDSMGNLLFPGVAANVLTESTGEARYHAFTVAVNKRWSQNFQFQAFYTWSRTESHDDNERDASTRRFYDPFQPDLDFGRSNFDIPHNFVANGVWELPLGIQLSGLLSWRSGATIDALTGTDSLSTSLTGASAQAIELIRAQVGDPSAIVLRSGNGDGNSSPDRPIVNGSVLERNAFRQDQFFQTDLRVAKIWRLGERHRIHSFIDMINVFDKDNFTTTNTRVDSASFLNRNVAGTPFLFQLGVKYSF